MVTAPCNRSVRNRAFWYSLFIAACAVLVVSADAADSATPNAAEQVRVPDGFEVTEFAGDDLAHDIFCMSIDSQGRVVVSGAGYIRILIDKDGDGRAETSKVFADGPKTGAQGLTSHGRNLLCIGDGGLLRYRDQNGDDRADGPPEVLLKLKTGGEHDAHAIQQGPDGWWYIIAGNTADITASYATLPTSPVKQPRAGTLLRFRPDLSGGEIFADGMRNAYDFTFNGAGDIFTYDSDDERDISLPWYRPTRVFQILPGSDLGWVSRSWKRPNYYFDMPPVVGSFGRGSPTGLACYRHRQFPDEYRDAIFALDWTYGRVLCLKLASSGSTYSADSSVFMSGLGGYGFAPTDCAVGPDGALYVSVGGRGTRGGVYKVKFRGKTVQAPDAATPLARTLSAQQPLAAWSRAEWWPLAKTLGKGPYVAAGLDTNLPDDQRVRAIEILTELFGGVDAEVLPALSKDPSVAVRARAVWSYGRSQPAPEAAALLPSLQDASPIVARAALEAAQQLGANSDWKLLLPAIAARLGDDDRFNRSLAAVLVARMPEPLLAEMSAATTREGARAVVSYAAGWIAHVGDDLKRVRKAMTPVAGAILQGDYPPDLKLDSLRLLQWMLGDMGPAENHPPAFDGYAARLPPQDLEREWDDLRIQLAELYPTGSPLVDVELSRVLAMLSPYNQNLLDRVLKPITAESDPIDDVHQLLVAAQLPVPRTVAQRQQIADALVGIDSKFAQRKLPQDSSWNDRFNDLFTKLAELDEFLAPVMVDVPGFGRPGHVLFMKQMPERRLNDAIQAFAKQAQSNPDYPWNNDVLFVLGASSDPNHREMIRQQFSRFSVRGAVLMTLSEQPQPIERPMFLEGLDSSQPEVLSACLSALELLPPDASGEEQFALLRTLRRLGQDEREYEARERVVKLLERNTMHAVPFVTGKAGYRPQPETVAGWTTYFQQKFPAIAATALGAESADLSTLNAMLQKVDWGKGDSARGSKLFETRSCASCHGGRSALGPDLSGVTGRFSKEDLFIAIVLPSRDVSARYQTTIIQTNSGKSFAGLIVYESVDGLLLRNATHQTFRIETNDIEERRKSPVSLMPAGLLKDLKSEDYADLYAYLSSLTSKPVPYPALKSAANAGQTEANEDQ